MLKLFALLALLLPVLASAFDGLYSGGDPCMDPASYLQFLAGQTSGTSLTQIIPAVAGQQIWICSMIVHGVSGTTPTLTFDYGSGSNCATGTTVIIPALSTAAGAFFPFPNPVTKVPIGKALCYQGGGTSPVQTYLMSYVQK
jgi:hypothetical protein